MTICWSCESNAGAGVLCAGCGAVQPPDTKADYFQVFGIARAFAIDLTALERTYKDLTKVLHPDRFTRADPRARRASLAQAMRLNEAWRTLRDPVKRAEYLLKQAGIELGGEEGTTRRALDGAKERIPVSQELLMETMELREALLEARTAGDHARVAALAADVRDRRDRAMAAIATGFAASALNPPIIAADLVAVRYYDRFLDAVTMHEETTASSAAGPPAEGRAGAGEDPRHGR